MLSDQLLTILRGIGADGYNLSVLLLELGEPLLKRVELYNRQGTTLPGRKVESSSRLLSNHTNDALYLPRL